MFILAYLYQPPDGELIVVLGLIAVAFIVTFKRIKKTFQGA